MFRSFFVLFSVLRGESAERYLSEYFAQGAVRRSKDMVKIENLHCVDGRLFVIVPDSMFEEIRKNPREIYKAGIGKHAPGIFLNTWHLKDTAVLPDLSDWDKLGLGLAPPPFDKQFLLNTDQARLLPVYVLRGERVCGGNRVAMSVVEKKTIIFSTMWGNMFRVLYAVSSAFHTLGAFNEKKEDVHFVDIVCKEHTRTPHPKEPRKESLRRSVTEAFGTYEELSPLLNKTYRRVFIGNSPDIALEEVGDQPADRDRGRQIGEAWKALGEKMRKQFAKARPSLLKQIAPRKAVRDIFLVVYLE
ncbi:MAG: uncharacterized protein A8A55_0801 [Amphiamblys sp. WSBS2006]|nr:MAG: uncharacterized protein A8A55_0801 [Amphiamblys sp. WSBS2006]